MDPRALLLVLLAATFHAAWNLRLHRSPDGLATLAVAGWAGALLLSPFLILSPPASVLPLVAASALAEVVYALLLAAAYQRGTMSVSYPLGRGGAPLLVTLGGIVVLQQRPAPLALLGAACLAAGLALVGSVGLHRGERTAMTFAAGVGVAVATYSLIDADAVSRTGALGYLSLVLALQAAVLTLLCVRHARSRLRASLSRGVQVGIGSTAAYSLVLLAFQLAPAGRVATLREVAVVIGVLVARERTPRRLLLGAALVVLGSVMAGV